MQNETEFALWITKCCLDGHKKLKLTELQIAYQLLAEAKRYLTTPWVEEKERQNEH